MGQTVEKQSVEERNKEVVRRYREAYNSGDLDALDEILSRDWTTHAWIEGLPRSVEAAKELHRLSLQWCPDWRSTTLDLIAEGDRVVERFLLEGLLAPGSRCAMASSPADARASYWLRGAPR